jgi:hypothetical protein
LAIVVICLAGSSTSALVCSSESGFAGRSGSCPNGIIFEHPPKTTVTANSAMAIATFNLGTRHAGNSVRGFNLDAASASNIGE